MSIEEKMHKIKKILNGFEKWAFTGSAVLYLFDESRKPNDIDIVASDDEFIDIVNTLNRFSVQENKLSNLAGADKRTRHRELNIKDIGHLDILRNSSSGRILDTTLSIKGFKVVHLCEALLSKLELTDDDELEMMTESDRNKTVSDIKLIYKLLVRENFKCEIIHKLMKNFFTYEEIRNIEPSRKHKRGPSSSPPPVGFEDYQPELLEF